MTSTDRMALLRDKCADLGQAEVARRIGRSGSTISQILSGKYCGDPAAVLQLIDETFGGSTVECPVLGEITLNRCANQRKKPFAATNPVRIALYAACKECEHNGGKQ